MTSQYFCLYLAYYFFNIEINTIVAWVHTICAMFIEGLFFLDDSTRDVVNDCNFAANNFGKAVCNTVELFYCYYDVSSFVVALIVLICLPFSALKSVSCFQSNLRAIPYYDFWIGMLFMQLERSDGLFTRGHQSTM